MRTLRLPVVAQQGRRRLFFVVVESLAGQGHTEPQRARQVRSEMRAARAAPRKRESIRWRFSSFSGQARLAY